MNTFAPMMNRCPRPDMTDGCWVRKRPSSPERCGPFELGYRSRRACAIWPCSTWRSTANCAVAISWPCALVTFASVAGSTNGPSSSKEKRTDPFSLSSRSQHGRPSNAGSWKVIFKMRTIFPESSVWQYTPLDPSVCPYGQSLGRLHWSCPAQVRNTLAASDQSVIDL